MCEPVASKRQKSEKEASAPRKSLLALVDGTALLFRAFNGVVEADCQREKPDARAVAYGFFCRLLTQLEDIPKCGLQPPSHFLLAFDCGPQGAGLSVQGHHTYRRDVDHLHKSHRAHLPVEQVAPVPLIRQLLQATGLAELSIMGIEADDIMATLARRGLAEGMEVVIASDDKDFCQLIQPGLQLLVQDKDELNRVSANRLFRTQDCLEKHKVSPEQVVDYLALVGDQSDGVPGVRGIGPKGARDLLQRYHSLDGILAAAAAGQEFLGEGAAEAARESRALVELQWNLQLPHVREPLAWLRVEGLTPARREDLLRVTRSLDLFHTPEDAQAFVRRVHGALGPRAAGQEA